MNLDQLRQAALAKIQQIGQSFTNFTHQNPVPNTYIGGQINNQVQRIAPQVQNTFNSLGNSFNTGVQSFNKPVISPLPNTPVEKITDGMKNIVGETGKQIIQSIPSTIASMVRTNPVTQLTQQVAGIQNPSLQPEIQKQRLTDVYKTAQGVGLATTGIGTQAVGGGVNLALQGVINKMQGNPFLKDYAQNFAQGVMGNAPFGPIEKGVGLALNAAADIPYKPLQKLVSAIEMNKQPILIKDMSKNIPPSVWIDIGQRAITKGVQGAAEGAAFGAIQPLEKGQTREQAIANSAAQFAILGALMQAGGDINTVKLKPIAENIGLAFKDAKDFFLGKGFIEKDGKLIKPRTPGMIGYESSVKFPDVKVESKPSKGGEIGRVSENMIPLKPTTKVPERPRGFTQSVQDATNVTKKVKGMVQNVYTSKPNDKLMGEAKALLTEGASIDLKNTQNIDQKIVATMQTALNEQRKNPQLAANLYNNLSEKGTELGRGVQAYSLLQKMSPDAIALSAAGKIKAYNRTATRKIPELSGDQVKLISQKVDALKKFPLGSRERNIAVNELSNTINNFIPSSLADKVITVWKAGLLTSLRTTERNIFGNTIQSIAETVKDLPATMADMLMSMATKKRTITPTIAGSGEAYSKRTGQQISDIIKLGYDASEDISKYDVKSINWGNNPIEQGLKKYTDIVFRTLGAQDKPFYNAAFKRSLFSQAGAEAINAGRGGDRAFINSLVNSPNENMIKNAISDANVATFHDKNSTSTIANAIKREMSKVKIGSLELGKIASEVVMPFTGVPSSILGQVINYSPIGLLKGIISTGKVLVSQVPDLQRQAAQEIGRGVIGSGVFGLGAYLASKGLITGQPKDAAEQRQWDLENKPRNSIMIGGKWRSLNSVGPEAVVFLAGAKLNEEMNNPEGSIGGYAGTLGKDYLDQSFVQGLQQPVNVITDPARYGKSYAGNMLSSGVPNIVKDASKALDTTQRETNTIGDYAKAAIPGVRNTLIEKRDALGNIMKQEPTGLGAFFDLFNSKTPIDNQVVNELGRLQSVGESATPSKMTQQQTILKQKVKLTFDQLNQLEANVGESLRPQLNALVSSPSYQSLSDEQKASAIQKVVTTVRNQAKNLNGANITNGNPTTQSVSTPSAINLVNKNGNVSQIDLNFQPTPPQLTGLTELDKKSISKFNGEITQKENDIYDLYKASVNGEIKPGEPGYLTKEQANTLLTQLGAIKSAGKTKKAKKIQLKPVSKLQLKSYKNLQKIKLSNPPKIKMPQVLPSFLTQAPQAPNFKTKVKFNV